MWITISKNRKNTTFEIIASEWLEIKKKEIKESSYLNYSYYINQYLMPELQNMNLEQLEKYDYSDLVDELNQVLAPKTIKDILIILKSIFYHAEENYKFHVKTKEIKAPKMDSEPLVVLDKNEKNKLEKYCLKENSLKSIGIIMCLYTGLRVGEICALKWSDIDLDKKELYVRKTLQRVYNRKEKSSKIIIDKPKTSSSIRNIPITNKLYNILKKIKVNYKQEDYFLSGESKRFVEPRNYQYHFKRFLKKSKVKENKFHILRHTFATDCIKVGMDIKTLSEILGHSSVEITLNKYVHSSYELKKKYLEKL